MSVARLVQRAQSRDQRAAARRLESEIRRREQAVALWAAAARRATYRWWRDFARAWYDIGRAATHPRDLVGEYIIAEARRG